MVESNEEMVVLLLSQMVRELRTIEQNINQNNFDEFANKFTDLLSRTSHNIIELTQTKNEPECKHNDWIDLYHSSGDFYGRYCKVCGEFIE